MKIVNICLYLYLLLKPFYLFPSGNLQIGDIFIVVAFFIIVFNRVKINKSILKNFKLLIIFIGFVLVINLIYYLKYSSIEFLKSSLYYVFIFMGIIVFSYKMDDYKFLKNVYCIFIIGIILQLIIYLFGIGRWLCNTRFQGTFNDPNQMGFFIIISIMFIYTLENILKIKRRAIYAYIVGIYMVFLTASTGMILAIVSFIAIQILWIIKKKNFFIKRKYKIQMLVMFLAIIIILLIYSLNSNFYAKIKNFMNDNFIESSLLNRLVSKIDKMEGSYLNLVDERGLDKLFKYPQYLLFGAGQGYYERFDNASHNNEIHSTLPSILFSYGIIPTIILLYWVYNNIKGLRINEMSVYIAILIESFTLLNQRQLLLWMLIILANLYKKTEMESLENEKQIN